MSLPGCLRRRHVWRLQMCERLLRRRWLSMSSRVDRLVLAGQQKFEACLKDPMPSPWFLSLVVYLCWSQWERKGHVQTVYLFCGHHFRSSVWNWNQWLRFLSLPEWRSVREGKRHVFLRLWQLWTAPLHRQILPTLSLFCECSSICLICFKKWTLCERRHSLENWICDYSAQWPMPEWWRVLRQWPVRVSAGAQRRPVWKLQLRSRKLFVWSLPLRTRFWRSAKEIEKSDKERPF